jgi:hypothetical protein
MNDLILNGYATPELEAALATNDAYPLVRELSHKHGLKVMRVMDRTNAHHRVAFCVGYGTGDVAGFPVGKVYVSHETVYTEDGKEDTLKLFNYQSDYFAKQRGRGENRTTVTSKKLVSLFTSMKKLAAIPTVETIVKYQLRGVEESMKCAENELGQTYKTHNLSAEHIHQLLKVCIEGSELKHDLIEIYKTELDKLNETDKMASEKSEEMNRMFGQAFYALGANNYGDMTVAKLRAEPDKNTGNVSRYSEITFISPFRPIKSLEEVPELIPVMTMLKVSTEGSNMVNGIIPQRSKLFKELDVSVDYYRPISMIDYMWALTPC